jgi:Holliday junction resolvasome RuvABC endonuclease subunit
MSKVLALDISSRSTGVCVYERGEILYCNVITLKQKSHAERLLIFEVAIKSIIAQYKPDFIAIEDCWRGLNAKTYKILSFYHGVTYKICYEILRQDPYVIMPSEIRKVIGDYAGVNLMPSKKERAKSTDGLDSKELTFNFIKQKFNLSDYTFEKHNDQTDAIAVAVAFNLASGDEHTRSIFSPGIATGSQRRGREKSVQKASPAVSPRPKPRKQRRRRKV